MRMTHRWRRTGCSKGRWPGALERNQRGASLLEYVILVGVVALVAVVGFRFFGSSVRGASEREAACVASLDGSCAGRDGGASSDRGATAFSGTGTAASASTQSGAGYWTKGIAKGAVRQAWDTVKGLGELTFALTPPGGAYYALTNKPNPAAAAALGLGKLALSASAPGRLVAAVGGPDPLRDAVRSIGARIEANWKRDKAETVGRGLFEVASILVPYAKAKWAANAAEATKLARAGALESAAASTEDAALTAPALADEEEAARAGAATAAKAAPSAWFDAALNGNRKIAQLRRLGAARGFDSEPVVSYLKDAIAKGEPTLDFMDGNMSVGGYVKQQGNNVTIGIGSVVGRTHPESTWIQEMTDHLAHGTPYAPKAASFDTSLSEVLYGTIQGGEKLIAEHPDIEIVNFQATQVVNQPLKRTLTKLGFVSWKTGEPLTEAEIMGPPQNLSLIIRRPPN